MTTLDRVTEVLAKQTGATVNSFSSNTRLEDLNLDSLEYVDFILTLRTEIKDVSEAKLMSAVTLKDLAAVLD